MKKKNRLMLILLCIAAMLCTGCSSSKRPLVRFDYSNNPSQESVSSQEGAVPDFEMTFLSGDTASFSDFSGKKIILNFWATWCGPCVGEMPAFQRLAEEYPDELVILAINCSEDLDTLKKFVQENGYTFPIVPDEDGTIQSMFGKISSIPLTILFDEEGNVLKTHVGAADADTMYATYKEELGL